MSDFDDSGIEFHGEDVLVEDQPQEDDSVVRDKQELETRLSGYRAEGEARKRFQDRMRPLK